MNRFRLITSGLLFLFSIYCIGVNPNLPFTLPTYVYIIVCVYFAIFPIKDMIGVFNKSSYKGKQFASNYVPNNELDEKSFLQEQKRNNIRAIYSMLFWLAFVSVPATLYFCKILGREWVFFFFALSNFSVFFAVFFWCPFHKIFIRQQCCNECRIYNWDSFFQYSFLILIPNIYTIILFTLGVMSLLVWEVNHSRHPKRFYKSSNYNLSCKNCDMEACKKHRKAFFSKKLKSTFENEKTRKKLR